MSQVGFNKTKSPSSSKTNSPRVVQRQITANSLQASHTAANLFSSIPQVSKEQVLSHLNHKEHLGALTIDKACHAAVKEVMRRETSLTIPSDLNVQRYLMAYIGIPGGRPSRLKNLRLSGFSVHNNDLKFIAENFPTIKTLILSSCDSITGEGLEHLKHLSHLNSLSILNGFQIKEKSLECLKAFANLTSLTLERSLSFYCNRITDAGLEHLKGLEKLTSLTLCFPEITGAGFKHFKALLKLTTLNLSDCLEVTDAGLSHLKALANLTSLNLNGCSKISNVGLSHLKSFAKLIYLNLKGCGEITDEGLEHLHALVQLISLELGGWSQVTGLGLVHLKTLDNLKSLSLSIPTLIDDELAELKIFVNLSNLNLSHCSGLTYLGLLQLKALVKLTSLDVQYCNKITRVDFEKLKLELPLVTISH